ncbi:nucleotidyltransferase family protein [Mesorhizobium xinjiangense]|uniref:nucleotidyltransferase family protein n=1 Tax=Mesorhizobium xinjiangense TaxID=2678685 RepID=UPI0012EE529C|nr:nucleotidyltransferase family protein [Mesorhizobium xinjiangense]
MDCKQIIKTLQRHKGELRKQGVTHAALFGSVARGNAQPDSDIDILIDLDPDVPLSVYDYVGLKAYIAGMFEGPVDVVNAEGLKSDLRQAVRTGSVHAF